MIHRTTGSRRATQTAGRRRVWAVPACLLWLLSLAPVAAFSAAPAPAGPLSKQELDTILEIRSQSELEFKNSPTSPVAAFGRLDLEPGQGGEVVDLQGKPWLHLTFQNGKYTVGFRGEKEVHTGSGDEESVQDRAEYPSGSVFVARDRAVRAYDQEGKGVLIFFDKRSPEAQGFQGLRYYEPDARYRVRARFVRSDSPQLEALATSLGRTKSFYRIGELQFEIDGAAHHLHVHSWDPDAKEATLFFRDATAGRDTHAVGRYLDINLLHPESVLLDFNRAYNAYCAYTDAYNCPLPPKDNSLAIEILAGEKTYPRVGSAAAAEAPQPADAPQPAEAGAAGSAAQAGPS